MTVFQKLRSWWGLQNDTDALARMYADTRKKYPVTQEEVRIITDNPNPTELEQLAVELTRITTIPYLTAVRVLLFIAASMRSDKLGVYVSGEDKKRYFVSLSLTKPKWPSAAYFEKDEIRKYVLSVNTYADTNDRSVRDWDAMTAYEKKTPITDAEMDRQDEEAEPSLKVQARAVADQLVSTGEVHFDLETGETMRGPNRNTITRKRTEMDDYMSLVRPMPTGILNIYGGFSEMDMEGIKQRFMDKNAREPLQPFFDSETGDIVPASSTAYRRVKKTRTPEELQISTAHLQDEPSTFIGDFHEAIAKEWAKGTHVVPPSLTETTRGQEPPTDSPFTTGRGMSAVQNLVNDMVKYADARNVNVRGASPELFDRRAYVDPLKAVMDAFEVTVETVLKLRVLLDNDGVGDENIPPEETNEDIRDDEVTREEHQVEDPFVEESRKKFAERYPHAAQFYYGYETDWHSGVTVLYRTAVGEPGLSVVCRVLANLNLIPFEPVVDMNKNVRSIGEGTSNKNIHSSDTETVGNEGVGEVRETGREHDDEDQGDEQLHSGTGDTETEGGTSQITSWGFDPGLVNYWQERGHPRPEAEDVEVEDVDDEQPQTFDDFVRQAHHYMDSIVRSQLSHEIRTFNSVKYARGVFQVPVREYVDVYPQMAPRHAARKGDRRLRVNPEGEGGYGGGLYDETKPAND